MTEQLYKITTIRKRDGKVQNRLTAPMDASGYYSREVLQDGTLIYRPVHP